ncbi:MAG: hypothetical protein HYX73_02945, partial [Acidobacteria bacterium]|nr:hypothetical protein [Acidobacteriota bacterium]
VLNATGTTQFQVGVNGGMRMTIDSDGDVGIGTADPAGKLEVVGDVKVSGGGKFIGDGSGLTAVGSAAIVDGAITSAKIADVTILNADISAVAAIAPSKIAGTAATLGANTFVGNQSVTGNVSASGDVIVAGTPGVNGFVFPDASKQLKAANNIRGINYIAGCDTCAVLADPADDQKTIYQNVIGLMYITEVTCFANTGSPTINLKRDAGGSPANILSAALLCNGTPNSSFNGNEYQLAAGNKIDFDLVAASTANRVTVVIKAVVQ